MYMPTNAMEALRMAKSAEKAATMFTQDGYTAELLFDESVPRVFFVQTPNGAKYAVDLNKQTCTCGDFAKHQNFCKHLIALELEEVRQEQEMDTRAEEDAEERLYSPFVHASH